MRNRSVSWWLSVERLPASDTQITEPDGDLGPNDHHNRRDERTSLTLFAVMFSYQSNK